MKLTIDTEKKTIKLHGEVSLNDLYEFINKTFAHSEDWVIEKAGYEPNWNKIIKDVKKPFQPMIVPNP